MIGALLSALIIVLPAAVSGATAPSLYVSPTGSDAGLCTAAAPCKTFARAYTVATAGATIQVNAGTYPSQTNVGNGGSKAVTFLGIPGNIVRQLISNADNITYDGINLDANHACTPGCTAALFENGGGDNNTFKNGSIGNLVDQKGALVDGNNFVFDNVRFHDVYQVGADVHNECVFAIQVPNMVIRNSTFQNCATMDLFFKYGSWWSPLPPAYGKVTLEGNTFWHSTCPGCNYGGPNWHAYGVYVGDTGPNGSTVANGWTIRNNWFENAVNFGTTPNSVICGNTGAVATAWKSACSGTPPPPPPPPPPATQCADTVDNDADGLIDLADPGCANAADNDETNAAPPPPPPPAPGCDAACENAYKAQLATLTAANDALQTSNASLQTSNASLQTANTAMQTKLDKAKLSNAQTQAELG